MTVDPDRAVALSAPDGHTRDVWVLSDAEQAPHVSLWRPTLETARVERSQRVIQSRVADDLFWLGRYSERADWTMRVLRGALRRVEEDGGPATGRRAARKCLEVLLAKNAAPHGRPSASRRPTSRSSALCAQLISGEQGPPHAGTHIRRALPGRPSGARPAVARSVADAEQVPPGRHLGQHRWRRASPVAVLDHLDEGLASIAAFNGLMHENMTRNFGWSFLDMGRRLERAYNLSEAIMTLFIPVPDAGGRSEQPAAAARTCRQLHHLSLALPARSDAGAGARSAAARRSQSAQPVLSARGAVAAHGGTAARRKRGVSLAEDRRLILALLTSIRLADVEAMAREHDGAHARTADAGADQAAARSVECRIAALLQPDRRCAASRPHAHRAASHDVRCQPQDALPLHAGRWCNRSI